MILVTGRQKQDGTGGIKVLLKTERKGGMEQPRGGGQNGSGHFSFLFFPSRSVGQKITCRQNPEDGIVSSREISQIYSGF